MDSNHRRRKPADLQSAPFGHSGNYPVEIKITNAHRSAIPISSAKVGINLKPTNFSAIFFASAMIFLVFCQLTTSHINTKIHGLFKRIGYLLCMNGTPRNNNIETSLFVL